MNRFLRLCGVLAVLFSWLLPTYHLWGMHADVTTTLAAPGAWGDCKSGYDQSIVVQAYGPIKLERPAKTSLCPGSDAIVLKAPDLPATYTWYWNGSAISGLNANTQVVSQPGSYYARVRDKSTGLETNTDTITLTKAINPTATLSAANPGGTFCERDSLQLIAGGGLSYQWFLNDREIIGPHSPTFTAKQAGRYSVTVTDANGCHANSDPLTITVQARPKPAIDSIPPVCGIDASAISLRASPPGGTFSGPGVSGSSFDPKLAGFGVHTISYRSPPANGCSGENDQRLVRVNPLPTVQLPEQIETSPQGIFTLEPIVTGTGPFSYQWQPAIWLNNSTQSAVKVIFPRQDTTYIVRVRDVFGCVAEGSIRIIVRSKASIPDAFTPNGDQINDTWKLPGIESYPKAQMTVLTRWGEVVFRSQDGYITPFDGRYNGEPLPTGVYLYILKLSPDAEPLRGSVVLAR
ncbi:T9SS type B sorting domain-containing protein [Spirosoma aureum]|uniref:T9SS type B sorting domain-containing protein n=1 Tax=Spirosoma aureum TaxID=2692134 RepID=A0A6G9AM25_9BACT|nr:gliding motility-associated C-terminal domain-containing protein [Spirosoma aureum]QIP13389.1 T9SS type B sorting domain-containing protein [Spirosoma aureum]